MDKTARSDDFQDSKGTPRVIQKFNILFNYISLNYASIAVKAFRCKIFPSFERLLVTTYSILTTHAIMKYIFKFVIFIVMFM